MGCASWAARSASVSRSACRAASIPRGGASRFSSVVTSRRATGGISRCRPSASRTRGASSGSKAEKGVEVPDHGAFPTGHARAFPASPSIGAIRRTTDASRAVGRLLDRAEGDPAILRRKPPACAGMPGTHARRDGRPWRRGPRSRPSVTHRFPPKSRWERRIGPRSAAGFGGPEVHGLRAQRSGPRSVRPPGARTRRRPETLRGAVPEPLRPPRGHGSTFPASPEPASPDRPGAGRRSTRARPLRALRGRGRGRAPSSPRCALSGAPARPPSSTTAPRALGGRGARSAPRAAQALIPARGSTSERLRGPGFASPSRAGTSSPVATAGRFRKRSR